MKKGCYVDEQEFNWPPPVVRKTFRLAMITAERLNRSSITEKFVQKNITGKVDDILRKKIPVQLPCIFERIEVGHRKVVLLEGGPGCGKSTLSLHICSEWAEGRLFPEYRLVILVRLRENAVQGATTLSGLLPQ